MADELLGTTEAAELMNTPAATLRYWRHCNSGPASFTLGRRVMYRRTEVNRWIAEREATTRRGGDLAC